MTQASASLCKGIRFDSGAVPATVNASPRGFNRSPWTSGRDTPLSRLRLGKVGPMRHEPGDLLLGYDASISGLRLT